MSLVKRVVDDLLATRQEAISKIEQNQHRQKKYFDKKRKSARTYKVGDLVLIQKQETSAGVSRKLVPPYAGQ